MHISMHSIIENQLEQNDPPEVQKALDGLLKRGASRHEAIHAIAYEFNMELFPVLKNSSPFNTVAYKHRLEKIARGRRSFFVTNPRLPSATQGVLHRSHASYRCTLSTLWFDPYADRPSLPVPATAQRLDTICFGFGQSSPPLV